MAPTWRSLLAAAGIAATTGCATPAPPPHDPDNVDVTLPSSTASAVPDRTPMHVTPAASTSGEGMDEVAPRGGRPRRGLPTDHDADGDGIPDDTDLCPTVPESGLGDTQDGCPQPAASGPDRDGDGLSDAVDRCPDESEDIDGFDDSDGCPDIDNDKDGIPDVSDACPAAPETRNGKKDTDGCPD